ncbi:DNA polymerase zeta catalytic subunit [Babesia sp. Xinjiang]|uniref:DNA polymerase zeta catalytic subunit n=1 Tax=Babesia sp. Xinjiang TaxID=462227 RepID=UPI000A25884C|nr:DNA polymerase zeta catalytic subunit [Babesia sp. Xinjiang]ORM41827.1 DNA polymerase zeta catalytic subunit [Babesia sp. Xinjiang]
MAVQLVYYDYVMAKPTEFDPRISSNGIPVQEVPVIRVFGANPAGQQVCLHVHGYLPYFYLPVPEDVSPTKFATKVHRVLENVARKVVSERRGTREMKRTSTAVQRMSTRRPNDTRPVNTENKIRVNKQVNDAKIRSAVASVRPRTAGSKLMSQSTQRLALLRRKKAEGSAYIHRVDVIDQVIFYGYHTKPQKFVKVYHYNPMLTKHLAGYACTTGIDKQKLQPYEVHISYLMHFMSDYSLKGMDYIYLSSAIKMRGPLPLHPQWSVQNHPLWHRVVVAGRRSRNDTSAMVESPILRDSPSVFLSRHKRVSTCELEIDAHIASILNIFECRDTNSSGSQELSQRDYAVGRYMGPKDTFLQHWHSQCINLQSASLSPLDSAEDTVPTYASNDTLREFYNYMMDQAQGLTGTKGEAIRSNISQLLYRCDDFHLHNKNEAPKTTQVERITVSAAMFHSRHNNRSAPTERGYYAYRFRLKPPKLNCPKLKDKPRDQGEAMTVQHNHNPVRSKVTNGRTGFHDEATQSHSKTPVESEGQGSSCQMAVNSKTALDSNQTRSTNEYLQHKDPPIDMEPVSNIVRAPNNFESGIVLDVITDIELNRIHPDPEINAINAVVYTLRDHRLVSHFAKLKLPYADVQGAIVVDPYAVETQPFERVRFDEFHSMALVQRRNVRMENVERIVYSEKFADISYVASERQLIEAIRNLILTFDPNVIYGFDIARNSIGYINQRAATLGLRGFLEQVSRVPPRTDTYRNNMRVTDVSTLMTHQRSKLQKNRDKDSVLQLPFCAGRLLFDLADVAVRELNLSNLSLENIVFDQFGYVMPSYTMHTINKWLTTKVTLEHGNRKDANVTTADAMDDDAVNNGLEPDITQVHQIYAATEDTPSMQNQRLITPHSFRALRYMLLRNYAVIATMDKLMYFQRYLTFSKLYGLDLKSAIVRGSQFHVESVLVRFTKSYGYVLPSPTQRQVHQQRASVAIPIVMQPISGFHLSPVAVLDFQSLYSCITIAYNICYSTCLGLLREHKTGRKDVKLGVVTYHPEDGLFQDILSTHANIPVPNANGIGLHIMPNGVMFVDKSIREGVLPMMLKEVLYSRRKIKAAMLKPGVDERNLRKLDREQHGLKMLSNLSVGLTASSYSGRMPCSDLAESVVTIARALILFCRETVHDNFDAEVIYGDTDSIFIKFPGRSVADAQAMAQDIVAKINASIPQPIKIVLQKVYSPCLLVSKKRYLGLAHVNGKVAFDDKGVETMRSSECDVTRRLLKEAMESVFSTRTLDKAYEGLLSAFRNVYSVCTLKDFIVYRQIRLGRYREDLTGQVGTLPAAAIVAKYKMGKHYGTRVLENEFIPHVFSLSRGDVYRGVKGGAVFPNEISGIFKPTEYVKEIGQRTLPQNSVASILDQVRRAGRLHHLDVEYYIKRQVLPPLQRMLQILDIDPAFAITEKILQKLEETKQKHERGIREIQHRIAAAGSIWKYSDTADRSINISSTKKMQLTGKNREATNGENNKQSNDHNTSEALHRSISPVNHAGRGKHNARIYEEFTRSPRHTLLNTINAMNDLEVKLQAVHRICLNCTGSAVASASCQNAWHCEVYFRRISYNRNFARALKEHRTVLELAYT